MSDQSTEIRLLREVEAVQIPSGQTISLPAGTPVYITQSLGGTYTVATESGLARISTSQADALGIQEDGSTLSDSIADTIPLNEKVYLQLKTVYDPEIPVDIVNLGLVYDCRVEEIKDGAYNVIVKMTLTAPGCGMGPTIAADAQAKLLSLKEIEKASVELVWDPIWNQEMITEEGKMKLGIL